MQRSTKTSCIIGLVVGLAVGGFCGHLDQEWHNKKTAIVNLCGGYNIDTGDFEWRNRQAETEAGTMPIPASKLNPPKAKN